MGKVCREWHRKRGVCPGGTTPISLATQARARRGVCVWRSGRARWRGQGTARPKQVGAAGKVVDVAGRQRRALRACPVGGGGARVGVSMLVAGGGCEGAYVTPFCRLAACMLARPSCNTRCHHRPNVLHCAPPISHPSDLGTPEGTLTPWTTSSRPASRPSLAWYVIVPACSTPANSTPERNRLRRKSNPLPPRAGPCRVAVELSPDLIR